ncbi:MAG: DUF6077 domain-containing protein [Roseburia sp.]|nr:DUF6077 domain-containing protein [Roseburia sp.]
MIKSLILLAVFMLLLPFLLGLLFTRFVEEEKNNPLFNLVAGYIFAMGVFEVIALPLIAGRQSLSLLIKLYGGVLVIFAALSLVFNYKRIFQVVLETVTAVRNFTLAIWAELVLIFCQLLIYVRYHYTNTDDAFYVASATTALFTDTIFQYNPYTGELYKNLPSRYVLSPFYSFIAVVSKAVDNHPAIIAHSVFMILFLMIAYMVYALIGKALFAGDIEKTGYFLILVTFLTMFSGYSERTSGLFLLIRLWQGKAVLAGIFLPLILYLFLRLFFPDGDKAHVTEWILLLFLMSACCLVSSMGIMLGAIMTGILGILLAVKKRRFRNLICAFLCCAPNIFCAGAYLLIR